MTTWKNLKQTAEDLQRVLIIKPVLTVAVKCNDVRLKEWITEAMALIAPGDAEEFRESTIAVLETAFAFTMPEWDSSGVVEEKYPDDPPDNYDPDDYIPPPPDDFNYDADEETDEVDYFEGDSDEDDSSETDDPVEQPRKMVRTKPPVEDEIPSDSDGINEPDEEEPRPKMPDPNSASITIGDPAESERQRRKNEAKKEWYQRMQRRH